MLSNPDTQPMKRALAPVIYRTDAEFTIACPLLQALIYGDIERRDLIAFGYSRYWHGYNALAGLALPVIQLQVLRQLVSALVWAAIASLAVFSLRSSGRIRLVGLTIALAAATVWAVPYFDQGLTYGPSDALLLLGLLPIVVRPRLASNIDTIVPYAATYAALMVFFDMNKGALPVAAGWLAALVLAASSDDSRETNASPVLAVATLIAFGIGGVVTLLLKQILAFTLAGQSGSEFLAQLAHWTAVPSAKDGVPGILLPFRSLFESSGHLAYGHDLVGRVLVGGTVLALCLAAIWAARKGRTRHRREVLVLLLIALVPVAWTLLQPMAVLVHAGFMVRFLVLPISLAPIVWLWPDSTRDKLRSFLWRSVRSVAAVRSNA
jgi:hypothetical protein